MLIRNGADFYKSFFIYFLAQTANNVFLFLINAFLSDNDSFLCFFVPCIVMQLCNVNQQNAHYTSV
jgi:hypothetical protein